MLSAPLYKKSTGWYRCWEVWLLYQFLSRSICYGSTIVLKCQKKGARAKKSMKQRSSSIKSMLYIKLHRSFEHTHSLDKVSDFYVQISTTRYCHDIEVCSSSFYHRVTISEIVLKVTTLTKLYIEYVCTMWACLYSAQLRASQPHASLYWHHKFSMVV